MPIPSMFDDLPIFEAGLTESLMSRNFAEVQEALLRAEAEAVLASLDLVGAAPAGWGLGDCSPAASTVASPAMQRGHLEGLDMLYEWFRNPLLDEFGASQLQSMHGVPMSPQPWPDAPPGLPPGLPVGPQLPIPTSSRLNPAAAAWEPVGAGLLQAGEQVAEKRPPRRRGGGSGHSSQLRIWASIELKMDAPGFDLVPMLIGRHGTNMRRIAEQTGAKVRIRGRGSGHLEMQSQQEAPTPLHVMVSADGDNLEHFRDAIRMTVEEIHSAERRFMSHCKQKKFQLGDGPRFKWGAMHHRARTVLDDIMELVPGSPSMSASRR